MTLARLILFDIDATLLTTSRAGIRAMGLAGRSLFGDGFDEHAVDYAGRLDPLIIADLLDAHGRDGGPGVVDEFRAAYGRFLGELLAEPGIAGSCPGVPALLGALAATDAALGLLTGNFPETGRLKLSASGLDPDSFSVAVWGSDSPHDPPARDHLPPVAMARFEAAFGHAVEAERVTIIGDTVHDVACARAHGCRSLGVATGTYEEDALRDAGADLVASDLSDTEGVLSWLLSD